jgi:lipopolysaccharide/colanic/teichoic acid biosynthesis glycosyltransferase
VKRGFDLVLSSLLLILSAPFTLLAALAILLVEGRPILFRQVRIGIRGNRFDMLKFRTMRCGADDRVHREYVRRWIHQARAASERAPSGKELFKLAADDRITTVGRALRRLSLDELPQLINVIRGEMSLIGPRPALPYEIDLYEDWHRRRLHAPPGITGLWQVSGRNHLSFDEMVRLDIQYLEDWSFIGDLRILARTMPVVLRGSGSLHTTCETTCSPKSQCKHCDWAARWCSRGRWLRMISVCSRSCC